jgi:hypothetical protein
MSGGDWDELLDEAREAAESGGVPASAGELIEIGPGEAFTGRHRGQEPEWGKSGAYLAWDDDDEPRFLWGCYSLDREFKREQPAVGARIAIWRGPNYKSRYDDEGEATGLRYGLACEPCPDPLPEGGAPEADDAVPFLCPGGSDSHAVPAAVAGIAST